jgi:hypothetical protein
MLGREKMDEKAFHPFPSPPHNPLLLLFFGCAELKRRFKEWKKRGEMRRKMYVWTAGWRIIEERNGHGRHGHGFGGKHWLDNYYESRTDCL